ncbi:MAG: hypothetical protein N3E51_04415, partial [Candidatus Micrarchaeota archaeon]|nr:hypothetical protein [Candidatus Micrarchaeota archaeon]
MGIFVALCGLTGAVPLSSCANLNSANTVYDLTQNISSAGTCINVTAANVTLNCSGFTITGANATGTYGVYSNQFNTTVRGCIISNFTHAIFYEGASNGSIINNTLLPDLGRGNSLLRITGSSNTLYWNNFTNTTGLYVNDTGNSTVPTSSMQGEWKFDVSGSATDTSGNARHGTIQGNVTFNATGKINGAYKFG